MDLNLLGLTAGIFASWAILLAQNEPQFFKTGPHYVALADFKVCLSLPTGLKVYVTTPGH